MGSIRASRRRLPLLVAALAALLIAAGCAGASSASPVPLRGNGQTMPLPSDAPAGVRALSPIFSCGASTEDEAGEDAGPDETAGDTNEIASPGASTTSVTGDVTEDDAGATCLIQAFDRHQPAQLVVASGDQDSGGRLTIYRIGSDGTIEVYVRLAPSFATPVGWDHLTCQSISLTDEGIVEDGCTAPQPIR